MSLLETLEGIGSLTTARAVTGRRCCVGGATSAAADTAKARTRAMFLAGELWILFWAAASTERYESWFFRRCAATGEHDPKL